MAVMTEKAADATAIRPFTIEFPEADLEDLRARIAATRWPEKEGVADASQGVQLATMQAVARYWETEHDWRKCEAKLNSVPNFITEIDGLDIHFVHVRSKHEDALPLIVCHGWPGSVIEQMKIVDLLTDPTAHGASASDAFHLVIPNMPGYGFSGKPATTGWDPIRMGRAYVALMKRLGYERFVAAGGDYGALVVDYMAGGRDAPSAPEPAPPELLGIHTNFPGVFPVDVDTAIKTGGEQSPDLSADERRAAEHLGAAYKHAAYAVQMGTRPQTMYGLNDSPVFLAAYMLDHDPTSYATLIRSRLRGRGRGRPDPRRHPRQHHHVLADQHGGLDREVVLGVPGVRQLRQRPERHRPGGRERLPRRALPGSPELDGEGVPQPRPLQRGRPRRALRRLGAAGAVRLRAARGVPLASLDAGFARVHIPSLGRATEWLNSEPLGPAELRSRDHPALYRTRRPHA